MNATSNHHVKLLSATILFSLLADAAVSQEKDEDSSSAATHHYLSDEENMKIATGRDLPEYWVVRNFFRNIERIQEADFNLAGYLAQFDVDYPSPAAELILRESSDLEELFEASEADQLASLPETVNPEFWNVAGDYPSRRAQTGQALATGKAFGRLLIGLTALGLDPNVFRARLFEIVSAGFTMHFSDIPEAHAAIRAWEYAFEIGIERGTHGKFKHKTAKPAPSQFH